MKSFKHWTRQDIADEFGLQVTENCTHLLAWLAMPTSINEQEQATLDRLQSKLKKYVDIWNEQELIIKFITFIIELVDYDTKEFKSFANRKLKGQIGEKEVAGEVDLMVASGAFEPKRPYFCLHEYKKETGSDNDPLGQLLIAMLAAKSLNDNDLPIYGAYVTGRNWFFLTLVGGSYCISGEYVATRNDIYQILGTMKNLKKLIQSRLKKSIGEQISD